MLMYPSPPNPLSHLWRGGILTVFYIDACLPVCDTIQNLVNQLAQKILLSLWEKGSGKVYQYAI